MPPSSVETLAHTGRALLLLGSLSAFGTAAVWTWQPEWVHAYEARRRDRILSPPEALIEEAVAAQEADDPATALALYEEVDRRTAGARPGDRLAPARTIALEGLVELHGDPLRKLQSAEDWAAFDEQSAPALTQRAQARYAIPEQRERGLEEMQAVFELLPETLFVAEAWVAMLADAGRFTELIDALALHYERLESSHWKLTWAQPAGGASRALRDLRGLLMAQRSGDAIRIEWALEAPVDRFRLYLPPYASMTLIGSELTILRPEGGGQDGPGGQADFTIDVARDAVRANGLAGSGRALKSRETGNAFFEFQLPAEARGPHQRYVFRAGLGEPAFELVRPYIGDPRFAAAIAELRSTGREPAARWAQRARLNAVGGTSFQLFYRSDDQGFVEARSQRVPVGGRVVDGALSFTTRLNLAGPTSQLRLDFPDTLGLAWTLDELTLEYSVGEHQTGEVRVTPEQFAAGRRRGLEFTDGHWVVTQFDPWIEFGFGALPDGANAQALRIVGSVR